MRLAEPEFLDGQPLPRELPSVGMDALVGELLGGMFAEDQPRRAMTREEYRESYLRSDEWRATRSLAIERAGRRCADCGFKSEAKHLDVHHLTYERLGAELLADLIVVCRGCHEKRHEAHVATPEVSA